MLYKLKGDCTEPIMEENTFNIICHCVNDLGIAGSGVIMAIDAKWKQPVMEYKTWHSRGWYKCLGLEIPFKQGQAQLICVEENLFVANLIDQSGIGYFHGLPAVRYEALEESLLRLKHELIPALHNQKCVLHFPEICCGRAGGQLDRVCEIIERVFPDLKMFMYQYDGEFK